MRIEKAIDGLCECVWMREKREGVGEGERREKTVGVKECVWYKALLTEVIDPKNKP